MLARTTLICELGCASKCWDNSKYVSTCVQANEIQCLCEDAEFQSVCVSTMSPYSTQSALLIHSRWCSNVSTLNARLLNSAPPFTKPFRHALTPRWMPPMPCLLSSVIKVYVSAEARAQAMHQVISRHRQSTPWLVALSVRRHTSVLVQHAVSAIFLFTRMTCRCHYQWLLLYLQAGPT